MTAAILFALSMQVSPHGFVPKSIRRFNENESAVFCSSAGDVISDRIVIDLLSDKRFHLIGSGDMGITMWSVSNDSHQAASGRLRHCPELTGCLILPEDGDTVSSPEFGRGFKLAQADEEHRSNCWEPVMHYYEQLVSPHFYKLEAPKLVKQIWSRKISYKLSSGQEVVGTNFVAEIDDGNRCTFEWLQCEGTGARLRSLGAFTVKPKSLGLPLVKLHP